MESSATYLKSLSKLDDGNDDETRRSVGGERIEVDRRY